MEHAIGTRITLSDGRKAEVVEYAMYDACRKCALYGEDCFAIKCIEGDRTDHRNIIYKEVKDD